MITLKTIKSIVQGVTHLVEDAAYAMYTKQTAQVFATGGCLRDIVYGNTPKDVDCVIQSPEFSSDKQAFEFASNLCSALSSKGLSCTICFAYGIGDDASEFGSRWAAVIKTEVYGAPVDILLSRDCSIYDCVSAFDIEINMLYMCADGIVRHKTGVALYPSEMTRKHPKTIQLLKPISEKRKQRIQAKFPDSTIIDFQGEVT